jgi:hypothetical protein
LHNESLKGNLQKGRIVMILEYKRLCISASTRQFLTCGKQDSGTMASTLNNADAAHQDKGRAVATDGANGFAIVPTEGALLAPDDSTGYLVPNNSTPMPSGFVAPLPVPAEESILLQVYTRTDIYGWTVKEARENRRSLPFLAAGIKSIRQRESTRLASIKFRANRKAELDMLRREQRQPKMWGEGPR